MKGNRHEREALSVLRQELKALPAPDPGLLLQAIDAAGDLAQHARKTWPEPADAWERLVLAVAASLLRVQGALNVNAARAVALVRSQACKVSNAA